MANSVSTKRLHIEKANATMAITVAIAAFLTVFSLFASRALLAKRSYQNRVIGEKQQALDQLHINNDASVKLVNAYKVFVENPDNIIGGSSSGKGEKDGDNAQIILDALPSKYDYPALISSVDKLITNKGYKINTFTGIDDELKQSAPVVGQTQAVPMPFQVGISGDFKGLETVFKLMEQSIRPFEIQKIVITGDAKKLTTTITAQSYYQPAKSVSITTKVVK